MTTKRPLPPARELPGMLAGGGLRRLLREHAGDSEYSAGPSRGERVSLAVVASHARCLASLPLPPRGSSHEGEVSTRR